MQSIHAPVPYLSAPRLLLKNASTAGVVPSETLPTRLSPNMSRLIPLAYASHRDPMAVTATIATPLEIARRDAADPATGRQAVSLLTPTIPKRLLPSLLHTVPGRMQQPIQ